MMPANASKGYVMRLRRER